MGEFSIKIKVAGSEYPLRLNQEDEEIVLKAASIINERYFDFEKKYSHVREKKDILAMAFLQLMVDVMKGEKGKTDELNRLQVFATEVNNMMDEHQDKVKQYKS
jgi:hypothetical protein